MIMICQLHSRRGTQTREQIITLQCINWNDRSLHRMLRRKKKKKKQQPKTQSGDCQRIPEEDRDLNLATKTK